MSKLSWPMLQLLAHYARQNTNTPSNLPYGAYRPKPHAELQSSRGLKRRELIEFDDKKWRYVVTPAGEHALFEHGFEANGAWRGSNSPRKYR